MLFPYLICLIYIYQKGPPDLIDPLLSILLIGLFIENRIKMNRLRNLELADILLMAVKMETLA